MRIGASIILALILPTAAFAKGQLKCVHYIYTGVPFITVTMNQTSEGRIERIAQLTHYGQTRQTVIEERSAGEDLLYSLVVDAGSSGGEVFLEIYKEQNDAATGTFKAKLINPQSPAMKEMPGQCDLTERE